MAAGRPWTCGKREGLEDVALGDLRLFVHDFRTLDAEGVEHAAQIVADPGFATTTTALLDFVAATAECHAGTRGDNARIALRVAPGPVSGLRFRLGVPFKENHDNPAVAEGPLAIGSMNWGWQAGYKFLRLEGDVGGKPMRVHLGETGCEGTIGHVTACGRSNRAEVTLRGSLESRASVDVDVVPLMKPATPTSPPSNCMGEPDEACTPALTALGLDPKSGRQVAAQTVFALRVP